MPSLLALAATLALVPSAPAAGPGDAALERALAVIRAEDIRADLRFIASDELRGRDTPSPGLRIAARFIRARLQRLGLRPAGEGDGWFHVYSLVRSSLDRAGTHAAFVRDGRRSGLEFGREYFFYPGGACDLDLEAPVSFAGRGTAEDCAGLALEGRWALALFDASLHWRERRENVRRTGAVGLIVAEDPRGDDDALAGQAPGIAAWTAGSPNLRGSEPPYPLVYVGRSVAEDVLGPGPHELGADLGLRFSDRRAEEGVETVECENVLGLWPGSDPVLSREVIVVSAHYDHVGAADGEVFNGADDNGSGTCGLLALAEALVEHGPMRRSILLAWVSGEEKGLFGSRAWARAPTLPEGLRPILDLNVDMIGRNPPAQLLITPTAARPEYNGLVRLAEAVAPREGFPTLGSADEFWQRSDHANFHAELGIPVAFLFSGIHEDYHQPTDTIDKIDFDKVRRVSRLVLRMLAGLQADELDLE